MIQDIAPHKYANEYKPLPPNEDSFAIFFQDGKVLVKEEREGHQFPRFRDLEDENPDIYHQYLYLFRIDDVGYYLMDELDYSACSGYTMKNVSIFRNNAPSYQDFAGITAYQLQRWYQSRRFCGICGKPMVHSDKERMVYCVSCKQPEYPKICPAVIVGITNGDKILMSTYAGRSTTNKKSYALIAGFTEIGESVEETVHREVMEEVGLKVKNLRFYKSQPWSFTDTLLMGFFVDVDGDDTITLDREELQMADWFSREQMDVDPNNLSLTNEMMMYFKNHGELVKE